MRSQTRYQQPEYTPTTAATAHQQLKMMGYKAVINLGDTDALKLAGLSHLEGISRIKRCVVLRLPMD